MCMFDRTSVVAGRRDVRSLWIFGVIALVVGYIYWPVIHGRWLWDDNTEITRNLDLRGRDALWKIWFAPSSPDYFPIKSTAQWVQWQIWGDSATTGYHCTNLALHALAAFLLGRVLIRLGVRSAWWGAMLFAVHPLAVESVAWIAEMKNPLSLVMVFLAMLAFLRYDESGRQRDYFVSVMWFIMAMTSKSSVAMFPLFFLLFAWWKRRRITFNDLKTSSPFFAIALILGLVAVWMQNSRAIGGWELPAMSFWGRINGAGRAVLFYAGKVFWPGVLMPVYPAWSEQNFIWGMIDWGYLAFAFGLFWIGRASWGKHAMLGAGWFCLNLVPVLGFVPMSYTKIAPVADHFAYLALAGGSGLLALGVDFLRAKTHGWFSQIIPYSAVAMCLFYMYQSNRYAEIFYSPEVMWRYTISHNPSAWVAHGNLATLMLEQGNIQEAELHARATVQLNPNFAPAQVTLGNTCMQGGHLLEAIEHYRVALALEADSYEAHFNLANVLVQTSQLSDAELHYEAASRISPSAGDAHFNLANTLVSLGRLEEALKQYSLVLAVTPRGYEARVNRGNVHAALGHWEEAVADFDAALAERPSSVDVIYLLADALSESGRLADAIRRYEQAIRMEPNNPELHRSYAKALFRAGDLSAAEQQIKAAVQIEVSGYGSAAKPIWD